MPEAIVFFRHLMQPVREHFCGVNARRGTGKTQLVAAQDALVRVGTQEALISTANPGFSGFFRGVISSAS
ncbi:hypothetical protein EWM60_01935 [Candidatus Erwinia dacicola]|nr:hypothetical protein [Candidatus Erwinia dacicola]